MIPEAIMSLTAYSTLPLPTATMNPTTSSVAPIPTVVPDKPEFQLTTETGYRTLWVVFIIMVISSAVFAGLAWKVPVQKRFFHVITTLITVIASLSYFAMATGHGVTLHRIVIHEQHDTVPDTWHVILRHVFFARYIDWAITTPLLLIDLAALAGLSGASIFTIIVADLIMIFSGLFSAFGRGDSPQKWGWYAIGCLSFLVVVYHLVIHGRNSAIRKSSNVGNFYTSIATFTIVLWTLYPIIWGVADGARKLTVDREIIAYAILDILAKPVFGTWLLFTHARLPEAQLEVGGFWSYGFSNEGQLRLEEDEGA